MPFTIRDATLTDRFTLEAIGENALEMFGEHECKVEIPEYVFEEQEITRVRVAINERCRKVGYSLTERHGDDLYLRSMYVHSSMNHSGVGSLLLADVLNFAKEHGAQSVSLLTSADSAWSVPFYKKFGFDIPAEDRLPEHIRTNLHAVAKSPAIISIPHYLPLVAMSRTLT